MSFINYYFITIIVTITINTIQLLTVIYIFIVCLHKILPFRTVAKCSNLIKITLFKFNYTVVYVYTI